MTPRIVSMISSATEIVHALGALPWLVDMKKVDCPATNPSRDRKKV
jgi:hypothetical protein